MKVLLVDDEEALLNVLSRALCDDFNVLTANNGDDAYKILENEHIDALVADHRMPGRTGLDLLADAAALSPGTARILCTASESPEDLKAAVNHARVHAVFTKPIRLLELKTTLHRVLAHAHLEAENARLEAVLAERNHELQKVMLKLKTQEQRLKAELDDRLRGLEEANRELERLALRDGLTGVYNRRFFEEAMRSSMAQAIRYGSPLSLIMLDVDHFKKVNDAYGHPVGDAVLKEVANLLSNGQGVGRASDVVARYGGEEFVIILPRTDKQGAAILAARLRARIARAPVSVEGSAEGVAITASLGVATFPDDGADADTLVRMADEALFCAKQGGRDQVRVAGMSRPIDIPGRAEQSAVVTPLQRSRPS